MKEKNLKILALGIVLVLPVFFLLVFKPLAKIPRPKAPHKMFGTGLKEVTNDKGDKVMDSTYHVIPNFKLQTQSGDSLELDSLYGNIYVAEFFFATCPGICPKMNSSLERVQQAFVKDRNFRIVSFSVDPAKDTLEALRRYADRYNAIPGKWYFLRSSKEDIFNLARNGFFITAKDDEDGGAEAFIHSEKLVLVDQTGNIRGYYSGVDSNRVSQLMGDIVLLLRDTEKGYNFNRKK
ncbi:MAG: SCO family protein [Bacteroidota bacterium]